MHLRTRTACTYNIATGHLDFSFWLLHPFSFSQSFAGASTLFSPRNLSPVTPAEPEAISLMKRTPGSQIVVGIVCVLTRVELRVPLGSDAELLTQDLRAVLPEER